MAHLFGPATKKLTGCIVIQQVCFQNLFKVFVHRFLIGSSLADCPSPLLMRWLRYVGQWPPQNRDRGVLGVHDSKDSGQSNDYTHET